jgi:hypothetical protein
VSSGTSTVNEWPFTLSVVLIWVQLSVAFATHTFGHGGCFGSASSMSTGPKPNMAIVTGSFIPLGTPS